MNLENLPTRLRGTLDRNKSRETQKYDIEWAPWFASVLNKTKLTRYSLSLMVMMAILVTGCRPFMPINAAAIPNDAWPTEAYPTATVSDITPAPFKYTVECDNDWGVTVSSEKEAYLKYLPLSRITPAVDPHKDTREYGQEQLHEKPNRYLMTRDWEYFFVVSDLGEPMPIDKCQYWSFNENRQWYPVPATPTPSITPSPTKEPTRTPKPTETPTPTPRPINYTYFPLILSNPGPVVIRISGNRSEVTINVAGSTEVYGIFARDGFTEISDVFAVHYSEDDAGGWDMFGLDNVPPNIPVIDENDGWHATKNNYAKFEPDEPLP